MTAPAIWFEAALRERGLSHTAFAVRGAEFGTTSGIPSGDHAQDLSTLFDLAVGPAAPGQRPTCVASQTRIINTRAADSVVFQRVFVYRMQEALGGFGRVRAKWRPQRLALGHAFTYLAYLPRGESNMSGPMGEGPLVN